ncbi:MAG TPA: hypothetical protein DC060_19530, partial [Gemmatimonadetes bacterium]|nr:hypothetical protein [Gemmatimonadota bacterium]
MPRPDPILDAVASCPTVEALTTGLPTSGTVAQVGGVIGSLGPLVLAALHRANRERVFVALAPTPLDAIAAEADL